MNEESQTQEKIIIINTFDDLKEALRHRPYKTEYTRVHKGRIAVKNSTFLIVSHKNSKLGKKYRNLIEVPSIGLNYQIEYELYESLWRELREKYNL